MSSEPYWMVVGVSAAFAIYTVLASTILYVARRWSSAEPRYTWLAMLARHSGHFSVFVVLVLISRLVAPLIAAVSGPAEIVVLLVPILAILPYLYALKSLSGARELASAYMLYVYLGITLFVTCVLVFKMIRVNSLGP